MLEIASLDDEIELPFGFPVVVKALSDQRPHKTDVGGVALGVTDVDGLRAAARRIVARAPYIRQWIYSALLAVGRPQPGQPKVSETDAKQLVDWLPSSPRARHVAAREWRSPRRLWLRR